MRTLTAMAVGGALVYFLDPTSGRERRTRARRGLENLMNMGQRAAVESGRPEVADAIGKVQRVAGSEQTAPSPVVVPG